MAITTKKEVKVELPKEVELTVQEVEDNSIIVKVDGWRMRVYYDESVKKERFHFGQSVLVSYFGDIENPHTIKFEKLK